MFSVSCHYGLLAMIYIARHSTQENYVSLGEIAKYQQIPRHFLSKLLQMLVKYKLLISMKGPNGGFRLSRDADTISLIEIVDVIDGLDIFSRCGIGFKQCDDAEPCPIHDDYKKIRTRVLELFRQKSLGELTAGKESADEMIAIVKPAPDMQN